MRVDRINSIGALLLAEMESTESACQHDRKTEKGMVSCRDGGGYGRCCFYARLG